MATDDLVMSDSDIASAMTAADAAPATEAHDEAPAEDDDLVSTWEDPLVEDDAETAGDDQEAAAQKAAQRIRKVKANGQVHDVDMGDETAVDRLLSLGLGARPVFAERDKLKKSNGALQNQIKDLQKYKGLWDKLEASKSNRDALYEKIFGEKFSDAIARESQRQQAYESATPEERRIMDLERKYEERERELAARQAQLDENAKQSDAKTEQARVSELRAQLIPEFGKYEFSTKVKDPDQAARLNKRLWRETIAELKSEFGELDAVPQHAVRAKFKEVHDDLWGSNQQAATQAVKKTIETKKVAAREQAQAAATRNLTPSNSNAKGSALAKEKDPVKLWRKMFKAS